MNFPLSPVTARSAGFGRLLIVFACCCLTPMTAQAAEEYTAADITDLILITGQSNVRGSMTVYNPDEFPADLPHPQVFAFVTHNSANGDVSSWQVANLNQPWDNNNWHPGNGAANDDKKSPYNNFALHLGRAIVEADAERVVGFVLASAPGEGIAHWDADSTFYTDTITRAEIALQLQGLKSEFDAVIWHQGETDWQYNGTSDPDASATEKLQTDYYPQKLSALIQQFRAESIIDDKAIFICGETLIAPVNGRLMELNDDTDPNTGCVSSIDATGRDSAHFNAAGLRLMGQRYGDLYTTMRTGLTVPQPQIPSLLVRNSAWSMISMPARLADGTTPATVFANQLGADSYGSNWLIFGFNSSTNQYYQPALDDELEPGRGYWIIQATGTDLTVQLPSNAAKMPLVSHDHCTGASCVSSEVIASDTTAGWNLAGYPLPHVGNHANLAITADNGPCIGGCSLQQGMAGNVIHASLFGFDSAAQQYQLIGAGQDIYPWQGYWLLGLPGASATNTRLLYPDMP